MVWRNALCVVPVVTMLPAVTGPFTTASLDGVPRLGLLTQPSPITALPHLATQLGMGQLHVKRDDKIPSLFGGTKPRKLDYLLATPVFTQARGFTSMGALSSGHLVTLCAAGKQLGRPVEANLFGEPPKDGPLHNLAYTVTHASNIRFFPSRVSLGIRRPGLLLAETLDGNAVVPPGASCPPGTAGTVRAGLELARQVLDGELPSPAHVYVALGSGGTAAGLALGLGMAGLHPTIHAVATVERVFSPVMKLHSLIRATAAWLGNQGLPVDVQAAPIVVERAQLGRGYGHLTPSSVAAKALLQQEDIGLETTYTGKAFSALVQDASDGKLKGANVLFWNTARTPGALPETDNWEARLPENIRRHLHRPDPMRRRLLWGGVAAAGVATAAVHASGYEPLAGFPGSVLATWEAHVVMAAAEALLDLKPGGPSPLDVAVNVDRFLAGMPPPMKLDIHMMLASLEHATTPLGLRFSRLTRLSPSERLDLVVSLQSKGTLLAQAYRGIRDLVLMGYWQDPRAWKRTGYTGPLVDSTRDGKPRHPTVYDALVAPAGARPRSALS